MPAMNGIILANQIRLLNNTLKILMLTAHNVVEIKMQPGFETAKIDEVLQKPFKLMMLKNIVRNMVSIN